MPPSVGMRFGRYELLSRLGAGGMGEVWRARDHDLHRDVAVKFLPEKFATDPSRFSRFSQEARAASSLNHPNIVTIHEIGDTSGLHFIVMELVEGHTLRELLQTRESRPFTPRRLLEIGAQIAEGLAKAHAAGIVHRDLKPENVMVTADGFVKVLDFGLAKLRADGSGGQEQWFDSAAPTWPESPSPQTAVGAVLGTAGYMSPEQARGRPVDHRSDQFTLGTILYEMATGRQPFRRETPAQTIAAIIDDTPEPLHLLCPALPSPVRWLIERCLAKEPGERYASTLDLARELRSLREHLPEVASTGSSPPGWRPRALAPPPPSRRLRPGRGGPGRGRDVARAADAGPRGGGARPAGRPGREAHRRPPLPGARGERGRQGAGRGRRRPPHRAPGPARARSRARSGSSPRATCCRRASRARTGPRRALGVTLVSPAASSASAADSSSPPPSRTRAATARCAR